MPLNRAQKRTDTQKQARKIVQDVLNRNGKQISSDFTNKEVYLLLLDQINTKLDEHLKWANLLVEKYMPVINKQGEILDHIIGELPDKGFCGKVDKLCEDMYPKDGESLPDKVKTLWYDRKILKWVLGASMGALIVSIITLISRYVFPMN